MTNSRRGFLASLLALLPLARSAKAGGLPTGTIRLFNGSPLQGGACVAQSITSINQFVAVNAGNFVDFQGTPGSNTAVSVIDFQTGTIRPAIAAQFPAAGVIKLYSFYFTTNTTTGIRTTILVPV